MTPESSSYHKMQYTTPDISEITGLRYKEIETIGKETRAPMLGEKQIFYLDSLDKILDKALGNPDINPENKQKIKRDRRGNYTIKKDSIDELLKTVNLIRPEKISLSIQKRSDRGCGYAGLIKYSIRALDKIMIIYEDHYSVDKEEEIQEIEQDRKQELEEKLEEKKLEARVETCIYT